MKNLSVSLLFSIIATLTSFGALSNTISTNEITLDNTLRFQRQGDKIYITHLFDNGRMEISRSGIAMGEMAALYEKQFPIGFTTKNAIEPITFYFGVKIDMDEGKATREAAARFISGRVLITGGSRFTIHCSGSFTQPLTGNPTYSSNGNWSSARPILILNEDLTFHLDGTDIELVDGSDLDAIDIESKSNQISKSTSLEEKEALLQNLRHEYAEKLRIQQEKEMRKQQRRRK